MARDDNRDAVGSFLTWRHASRGGAVWTSEPCGRFTVRRLPRVPFLVPGEFRHVLRERGEHRGRFDGLRRACAHAECLALRPEKPACFRTN